MTIPVQRSKSCSDESRDSLSRQAMKGPMTHPANLKSMGFRVVCPPKSSRSILFAKFRDRRLRRCFVTGRFITLVKIIVAAIVQCSFYQLPHRPFYLAALQGKWGSESLSDHLEPSLYSLCLLSTVGAKPTIIW